MARKELHLYLCQDPLPTVRNQGQAVLLGEPDHVAANRFLKVPAALIRNHERIQHCSQAGGLEQEAGKCM